MPATPGICFFTGSLAGISSSINVYPPPVHIQGCGATQEKWNLSRGPHRPRVVCSPVEVSDLMLRTEGKQFIFYFYLFILKDFIYLFMRDTERERQRYRQREKQAPHGEPHVGLDPGTSGSHPEPKADGQPLSHPGRPRERVPGEP